MCTVLARVATVGLLLVPLAVSATHVTPSAITFGVLHADCGGSPPAQFDFFLNDVLVASAPSSQDCICNTSPLQVTLTDAPTLALFDTASCNRVRVGVTGAFNVALAQVYVEVSPGTTSACLFDGFPNNTAPECNARDLCTFPDFTFNVPTIQDADTDADAMPAAIGHGCDNCPQRANPAQAACMRQREYVKHVEQDRWIVAAGSATQSDPPWHLDRVDQESPELDGTFTYPDDAGEDVTIWILDSGVNESPDLTARVTCAQSFVPKTSPTDCHDANGHGTHVAGVAAGETFGVAKKASVRAVRVLDKKGKGQNNWIQSGVEWVAAHRPDGPAVANMSLTAEGDGTSVTLDNAVKGAISQGTPFVIAAGNAKKDACDFSPSDVLEALVVGATERDKGLDKRRKDSNQGSCVDLFAPGDRIKSYWGSKGKLFEKGGTSCSAPHVAGAVALFLASHKSATISQIEKALRDATTDNKIDGLSAGTPNQLLRVTP